MAGILRSLLTGGEAWANGGEIGGYDAYIGGLWLLIFVLAAVALVSFFRRPLLGRKKCPYCAERIARKAVKCRYCGERLEAKGQPGPSV